MIVIYGIRDHLDPIKTQLSDVIHHCMQSVLALPASKRAHRFMPMAAADMILPGGRTSAYTVIEINLMAGRQKETLKRLIKMLFADIQSTLGIDPVDIEIIITEQPPHCWGFRGMTGDEAQDLNYSIGV